MKKVRVIQAVVLLFIGILIGTGSARAAVTQISACTTIVDPGSYALSRNLNGTAGGVCIEIEADFVTLNLNGFSIGGPGIVGGNPALSWGIQSGVAGLEGITVLNGSIVGFAGGIDFGSINPVDRAVIRGVRVADSTDSGIVVLGESATITDCTVSNNGLTGLIAGPGAFIHRNIFTGNLGHGASVDINSVVTNNIARDNTGRGLDVQEFSQVVRNVATDNAIYGIRIDCPSFVYGNTTQNNGITDIFVSAGTGCQSTENVPVVILP